MKLEIELDDQTAALLQAHADETGADISTIIGSERAVKDIARDKLHQALSRDLNEGRIPQGLVDSAVAFAGKVKADRKEAKAERLKV